MAGLATAAAVGAATTISRATDPPRAPLPGDVVTATAMTAYVSPGQPMAANAWRITYRSTTAAGNPTVVSGTVLVPTATPSGMRPLVGVAVGTHGLADRCAPSREFGSGTEGTASVIETLLEKGWAVAVTDYPGLGTPGVHTYLMGDALGRSVLDIVRAARRLPAAQLPPNGPLALLGYSEGGAAAGWAAQLQPTYAPNLHLVAAAIGGVPANVQALLRHDDGGPASFVVPYTAAGLRAEYRHSGVTADLTLHGRVTVSELQDTCTGDARQRYPAGRRMASITKEDLLGIPRVWRLLAANRLGSTSPVTTLRVYESRHDEIVPFRPVAALVREWHNLGDDVELERVTGNHAAAGVQYADRAIAWLADEFNPPAL
jgi:pimeloyl-ACP methyl ester carboxylesterase